MLEGLAVLAKERPAKPVEFLADYLEKNNTEPKREVIAPKEEEKKEVPAADAAPAKKKKGRR